MLKSMNTGAKELERRIESGQARIAVIGLGYVGLAVSRASCAAGFSVVGLDIDAKRVEGLNAGLPPFRYFSDAWLSAMIEKGFKAVLDPKSLTEADVILICVPTPLDANALLPDFTAIRRAVETAVSHARERVLIVLESTVHPHGSAEIIRPFLEARGWRVGHDVYVAFSPERENPGDDVYHGTLIPRVVGADDEDSRQLAELFYRAAGYEVHSVSSAAAAEAVKLVENTFRLVNIALANEFKLVFRGMGIDVNEVIRGAATKPFGFMPFYPGPGVGGHCIPVDPIYLTWQANKLEIATPLISLAADINRAMPLRVAREIVRILIERCRRTPASAQILVLGLSYKRNIEDLRGSPSLEIMNSLVDLGANVYWHDPWVTDPPLRWAACQIPVLNATSLAAFDLAVIATDHDNIPYDLVSQQLPVLVDTRGTMQRLGLDPKRIVQV